MKEKEKVLWITRTAAAAALLILVQTVTTSLGNTLVTGSCVNFLLILSMVAGGFSTGIWVAVLSPFAARMLGIGPLWSLIPFIALGNTALALIWHWTLKGHSVRDRGICIKAVIAAAAAKFLVLYLGIVKFAVLYLLALPDKQAAAVSQLFSVPQLFTALIGGCMAMAVLPAVCRAVGRDGKAWE